MPPKLQNLKIDGSTRPTSKVTAARSTDKGNAALDDTPQGSEGFTSIYRPQEFPEPLPSNHEGTTHSRNLARPAPPWLGNELAFPTGRVVAMPARRPGREFPSRGFPRADQSTITSGDARRRAMEDSRRR
ncbi:hypothetical protein BHM03_00017902 [Ensete ventricosum]|nr:hypothetical protein BHM03_00017902 [Ensete ventricosum]